MTAYQIGQLVGTVFGAVAGIALSYKLLKSPKKANRAAGVVVGIIGIAYIVSGALKSGAGQQRHDFEVAFRSGCVKECLAGKAEPGLCTTFCDCQVSKHLGGAAVDHLIEGSKDVRSADSIPPELRAQLLAVAAECMPPATYDANFMGSCTSSCTDAACRDRCRCILDKLREGMDPAAGTRWMMKNLDVDPPTSDGEARSTAAVAACQPAAQGE